MNATTVSCHRPVRRDLCLLLALLLIFGSSVAFSQYSEADRIYESGLQAFNNGDYRGAVIQLKNALQMDPTILSAHILLGRAYLEEGSGGSAERELKVAKKLGADPSLVLPALAKAYMLQREYQQVVDEVYPGTGDARIDSEILVLRGDSHLKLGELELSNDAYLRAAELRPSDSSPLLGKASVLLQRDEYDAAEAEVLSAIKRNPKDPKAWLLKGAIAHSRGDIEAAFADYEKALSLDPVNNAAQLARLGTLIDLGRDHEAVEAAKQYRNDSPEDARAAYLLAVVLARAGDEAGSQQALEEAYALLSPVPDEVLEAHAPTFLLSGVVAYNLGKLEEAHANLERYIETYPPAPRARMLLGSILMKKGDYAGAITVLEPVLGIEPASPHFLLMLGEAFMREGRHYPAGELFERAVRLTPDSAEAHARRAVNKLAAGQSVAAAEELAAVFDEYPQFGRVGTLLVDLYIKQGDAAAAAGIAERLVELEPDNLAHRNQLALALLGTGMVNEARQALEQILVRDPEYTAADLNLAKLDLLMGQVSDAAGRYQIILDRVPNEPQAMIGLARTLVSQDRVEEAIELLTKVLSGHGDITETFRLDAASALVEMLIDRGESDRALQVAEQAELIAPRDPRVLAALGAAHLALGDAVKAQSLFRRLSKDAGYDEMRLFEILRLQIRAADLDGALWSATKAIESNPNFLDARVKHIELLAALGKSDKAREAAASLAVEMPEQPEAHRVLGDVFMSNREVERATEAYSRALELDSSEAAVIRVYRTRLVLGQAEAARELLIERLETNPQDRAVRTALAESYLASGEWSAARHQYEMLIEGGRGASVHYNNLAVIYARDGDARAQEYARRAQGLDPDSSSTNDTLGWLLVQAGEVESGLGYLRKAEARAAQNPEIRYHIGFALSKLGRIDEARVKIEGALREGGSFSGRGDAEALLEELRR